MQAEPLRFELLAASRDIIPDPTVALRKIVIIALAILSPLLILCTWAFFYWSPASAGRTNLVAFNLGICALALVLSLLFTLYVYAGQHERYGAIWLSVLSTLGWFFIYPCVLLTGALLRNLVLFRDAAAGQTGT